MKRREEMSFLERFYLIEVVKGLTVTVWRFVRNLVLHILGAFGLTFEISPDVTVSYPDECKKYPIRYRGRHRLTLKDNGDIKCTACFLCATACPAKCIYIEASEHNDPNIEKFPKRYEIDTLLCIYCGYCVEACPVDAIRMDTGIHPEIYPPDPRMYIEDKEKLMMRSLILEESGPDALMQMHLQKMRKIEEKPNEPVDYSI